MSFRRGLTLIELLVVLGVIMVLMAILLPMVGRIRESANAAACQSNVRTLTQAFIQFSSDHGGYLPGSKFSVYYETDRSHLDWLFGQYSMWEAFTNPATGKNFTLLERLQMAPQSGTIWPYVQQDSHVYLCPSLVLLEPGSGQGTNGRFDYAAFSVFTAQALRGINAISQLHYPLDPGNPTFVLDTDTGAPWAGRKFSNRPPDNLPTPLICQEDALLNINSNLEGQHASSDQISHIHNGGSWYGSVDGSVNFINEPDTDPTNLFNEGTSLWWQNGPLTGRPTPLDSDPGKRDSWAHY